MIELAFVACLAATPSTCRDHTLLFTNTSLMLCVLRGQMQLAIWTEVHPGWEIESWSCRSLDPSSGAA